MSAFNLVGLSRLMEMSEGKPDIIIGLIDGPVFIDHPDFSESRIKTTQESQYAICKNATSLACTHGTFSAGILCAKRGGRAPAISPKCTLLIYPVFLESSNDNKNGNLDSFIPSTTMDELSNAIFETIRAGASIINLSLGLPNNILNNTKLNEVYSYAAKHEALIVISAGNQGNIGQTSLIDHDWVIPVASCSETGNISPDSNLGPLIGKRGIMAPGVNITSTSSTGGYMTSSGTSAAAPFVTGTLALLWSIFPKKTASDIKLSILSQRRRLVIPQILNANLAFQTLSRGS